MRAWFDTESLTELIIRILDYYFYPNIVITLENKKTLHKLGGS